MIKDAIRFARRSPNKRFKTGAVIIRDGALVGSGWAHVPAARLQEVYSMHAELHALRRANPRLLEGSICYVATLNQSGHTTLSRPCAVCAASLLAAGVVAVVFTCVTGVEQLDLPVMLSSYRHKTGRLAA